MYLRLDHHSGEPIYRQIVEQVMYSVASGELEEGERLPSIRALAKELTINPRTVVKAYEELAHRGLVVMRQGQGVFVTHGETAPAAKRKQIIGDRVRRLLAEASRLGATPDEVIEVVEREANRLRTKK
jgi:GntR family transcriptional regulator